MEFGEREGLWVSTRRRSLARPLALSGGDSARGALYDDVGLAAGDRFNKKKGMPRMVHMGCREGA